MERFADPATVVDRILERVGPRVVVGTPLGLGKANRIVDELYERARRDRGIELDIVTALGLAPPEPSSELERRLLDPIAERIFGGYPVPAFERDLRRDTVPPNVRVRSFFFDPGSAVRSRHAQRHHMSVNYSDAAGAVRDAGVNVLAQLVAPGPDGRLSLSCNPDLATDVLDTLAERTKSGEPVVACAELNRNLPYMGGDAELDESAFDLALDVPGGDFPLVGPPKRSVSLQSHLIGLHASSLVPDGGTIQIGIGALSDAIVWMLRLRHLDNSTYRRLLDAAGTARWADTVEAIGGTGRFDRGLYACSEMLVDGFLELMDAGILRRRAYDDVDTQRLADAATGDDEAPPGGHVAHAAFFLGPRSFYERLRTLSDHQRDLIGMTRVGFTNTLDGDRELKELQRRDARFLNTALQVTLLGATLSDAVHPARVVSGVGGQADFVSMAHALPGGRSATLLRATREAGRVTSNIVWAHDHVTIPRQERDIVVTEYGVADVRGRSEAEVAAALIEIADSRFQDELVAAAKAASKLPADYSVPERARTNLPERLADDLAPHRTHLPELPFGSDITSVEVVLTRALRHLERMAKGRRWRDLGLDDVRVVASQPPAAARPYLERMGLDRPGSWRERAWQRLVVYGLSATGALDGAGAAGQADEDDTDEDDQDDRDEAHQEGSER